MKVPVPLSPSCLVLHLTDVTQCDADASIISLGASLKALRWWWPSKRQDWFWIIYLCPLVRLSWHFPSWATTSVASPRLCGCFSLYWYVAACSAGCSYVRWLCFYSCYLLLLGCLVVSAVHSTSREVPVNPWLWLSADGKKLRLPSVTSCCFVST